MFWTRFIELCNEAGKSPNAVAAACGVKSSGTVTGWSKGSIPRAPILHKLAAYFHVSVDYLAGNVNDPFLQIDNDRTLADINSYEDEDPGTVTLTARDQRDIARDLERIMAALDTAGDLQFDGDPMSDEARESIKAAMKLGLEAAKVKNKERFTPRKYRKE